MAAINQMIVYGRAMRVAMDHARTAVLSQDRSYRCGRHVHDRLRLELLLFRVFGAQPSDDFFALIERLGKKLRLIRRITNFVAKLLVADVVSAERIAVQNQCRCAVQINKRWVREQRRSAVSGEPIANEEVAVAVH